MDVYELSLELESHEEAMVLFGPGDRNLKLLRDAFAVQLLGRGCNLRLSGDREAVERVEVFLKDMISRHRSGAGVPRDFVDRFVEKTAIRAGAVRGAGRGLAGEERAPGEAESGTRSGEDAGRAPGFESALDGLRPEDRGLVQRVARSRGQAIFLRSMLENEVVFCVGPAGTGKTFLAVYMAIHLLRADRVRRIVLCRPAVEAGEKLGFLPGDFQAKINPYLRPLYDALNDILDYDQVKRYLEREVIEVLPLAYMRGRTLNNSFIILDEGQNTTVAQMKMFLTRMGMNSRIVANGDITQVDLPDGQLSGLVHAHRIMTGIPGIGWVELESADVVRHALVRKILAAYEAAERDRDARR